MADTPNKDGDKKKKENIKSTVRNRKKPTIANTQRYLPFAEIRNDTVLLKNGGLRAVLQVEPLNFNLKSETEQQGIIAGYESFINTLVFPLQIVVRSTKVNIDPYLEQIQAMASKHENALLKEQTNAYAQFVEKIVDIADIMQKRFYVVVPLDDFPRKTNPWSQFLSWMNLDDTRAKALQRSKRFETQSGRLKERVDLVESGLHNIGLTTKRLKTLELIQLYYRMYNPRVSQTQKLPKNGPLNTEQTVI